MPWSMRSVWCSCSLAIMSAWQWTQDAARQAQAAYFSVASQLEQMATTRRADGNPMTRSEINEEALRLSSRQLELFRQTLRIERENYIAGQMSNIPGIGNTDPLADLDAWWASLDKTDQEKFVSDYARHRLTFIEFQQRMGR
jgi:type II secretory pathway pseudopilin PulG